MKTAELNDVLLNYWVAKAIGHDPVIGSLTLTIEPICLIRDWNRPGTRVNGKRFEPHKDWEHAGPIIKEMGFSSSFDGKRWLYWNSKTPMMAGPDPLIAAMRATVYSIYGEEVPDLEQPGA